MDSFGLGIQTPFPKCCEKLILNLVPASVCLVKRMKDSKTVNLIVLLINQRIKSGCSVHKECKLSELLQHKILVSSLLQEERFTRMLISEYSRQTNEGISCLSVLA
jgi:hypothetical protein